MFLGMDMDGVEEDLNTANGDEEVEEQEDEDEDEDEEEEEHGQPAMAED